MEANSDSAVGGLKAWRYKAKQRDELCKDGLANVATVWVYKKGKISDVCFTKLLL